MGPAGCKLKSILYIHHALILFVFLIITYLPYLTLFFKFKEKSHPVFLKTFLEGVGATEISLKTISADTLYSLTRRSRV